MRFDSSTQQDVEQLTEWIKNDPYHKDCLNPEWWLTGNGVLSYVIIDSKGPTMFVRVDKDNDLLRIHTQFAPDQEVSKIRVIKSIVFALPRMTFIAEQMKLKGMIFKSSSPTLIGFMQKKFGFVPTDNDDYILSFEEE